MCFLSTEWKGKERWKMCVASNFYFSWGMSCLLSLPSDIQLWPGRLDDFPLLSAPPPFKLNRIAVNLLFTLLFITLTSFTFHHPLTCKRSRSFVRGRKSRSAAQPAMKNCKSQTCLRPLNKASCSEIMKLGRWGGGVDLVLCQVLEGWDEGDIVPIFGSNEGN